jgi:tripartite-type tricarboxylate transporter receptor subunit TctC
MIKKTIVAMAIALSTSVFAQAYPDRPIELIVPYPAGGGTDVLARTFAKNLQKQLTKGILVINKTGAQGTIGLNHLIAQKPDGYTLLIVGTDLVLGPHVGTTTHTYRDVTPLAMINADPMVIFVRADGAFNTVDDLVMSAKKNPGVVSIGTSGLMGELNTSTFETKTGIKFNRIPYPGTAPEIVAVLGGQIDAGVTTTAEVSAFVAAGKVKILHTITDRKIYRGVVGPKDLPPEVINRLRTSIDLVVKDPEFQDALKKLNMEMIYLNDQEFVKFLAVEDQVYQKVFKK